MFRFDFGILNLGFFFYGGDAATAIQMNMYFTAPSLHSKRICGNLKVRIV
jgi:hypothetical protein